jgi:LysM repeat protein
MIRWYNRPVVSTMKRVILLLGLGMLLAACRGTQTVQPAIETATLRPYATLTATPRRATLSPSVPSPQPLGPTPTPWVHIVQSGDTLLAIASRYGVDYAELLVANPGIDPRLLSIGTEIFIPGADGQPITALLPTPTPVPLRLSDVRCFTTPSKAMWCLAEVRNTSMEPIEGIEAVISLIDAQGELLASQQVYGPLNLVREAGSLPLAAFFPDPPEEAYFPVVELVSAVPVSDASTRYADVDVRTTTTQQDQDGMRWIMQGEAEVREEAAVNGAQLSLLLVAYDDGGEVVGFRKWEPDAPLSPGVSVAFEINIFSLGPAIERVELLVEALAVR